jgi:hypothetical protein
MKCFGEVYVGIKSSEKRRILIINIHPSSNYRKEKRGRVRFVPMMRELVS